MSSSWELSDTLEEEYVIKAVNHAFAKGRPEILNSDQGSHFTSPQYTKMVLEAGVKVSMDGRGRALDNVFTERLWRSLKYLNAFMCGSTRNSEGSPGG